MRLSPILLYLALIIPAAVPASGCGGTYEAVPPVTHESAGGYDPDDAWLFSDKTIHRINITLTDTAIAALTKDPYTLVGGSVTIDDKPVSGVGVRLRGKIGSFRTLMKKPKFKIDFAEFAEGQRFYGLKALALNNAVVDCSYLKEPLGYHMYALAGVPASRTGFARVAVNGADYGLYIMIEEPDDRFLKRRYKKDDGNLYDGKYIWYGGHNYTLLDFNTNVDDKFALEEGQNVGNADIKAVSKALADNAGKGNVLAGMAPVIDWPEFLRMMATDQWTGANDSYPMNQNNYRVYFDPGNGGRMDMIPWDFDYSFLQASQWGKSWMTPQGRIARACLGDAACLAAYKSEVQSLIAKIDPAKLIEWFNQIDALTLADAMNDPRRECAASTITVNRQALRDYVMAQNGKLRAFWGLGGTP